MRPNWQTLVAELERAGRYYAVPDEREFDEVDFLNVLSSGIADIRCSDTFV